MPKLARTIPRRAPARPIPEPVAALGMKVIRRRSIGEGTFPSEILTCRSAEGTRQTLFCKYGTAHEDQVFGHKGGVAYEARVYERILNRIDLPLPQFIASGMNGEACLVLEGLTDCLRTHLADDPDEAMIGASRWIGCFHAQCNVARARKALPEIIRYDREYYLGWSRRTAEFSAPLHRQFPWIARLCDQFESLADELLAAPQCIIHGEYYPKNILWRDQTSYPIDWESAAIAPGEIDLASLTQGWPRAITQACEQAYREARGGSVSTKTFSRRLALAQLYQTFRWLGDRREWTVARHSRWLIAGLKPIADSLGISY